MAVNAVATRDLVAAVEQGAPRAHLVLVSSLAAAGPSVDGVGSDALPQCCQPVSAYGESKRLGELAVVESGLAWSILRPPVVYGPSDAATRLLFRQACAPVCAVPPVARPLSVIHVRDVVAAVLAAGRVRPRGAVLALDGPERTNTHQLLQAIAAACGRTARLLPIPLAVAGAAAYVCDLWGRITGSASFFNGDKVKELRAPGWVADGRALQHVLGSLPEIGLQRGFAEVAQREGFVRNAR
jgi:nucleoside-diphosphate-sugar epimerase